MSFAAAVTRFVVMTTVSIATVYKVLERVLKFEEKKT